MQSRKKCTVGQGPRYSTRLLPRFLNHQAATSKVRAKSAMFWGSKREGRAVHCFYGRFPHCVPCLVEDRFGVIGPETAERDREIDRMVEWTRHAFVYSIPVCGKFQPASCLTGPDCKRSRFVSAFEPDTVVLTGSTEMTRSEAAAF